MDDYRNNHRNADNWFCDRNYWFIWRILNLRNTRLSTHLKFAETSYVLIFLEDSKPFNKSNPIGQFRLGVALDLIQCKEWYWLVIRTTNSLLECIKTENVEKPRGKEGAMSEQKHEEIFAEIAFNRIKWIESSSVFDDFNISITTTPEEINNQRYLSFDGNDCRDYTM